MSEFQLAVVVFAVGFVVTVVTVGMIFKGHNRWKGRDPYDQEV